MTAGTMTHGAGHVLKLPSSNVRWLRAELSPPAAACSSPADSATGCSWTNRASLVSRRIHRLLRVPPTGSSASWAYHGSPTPRARPGGPGKNQPTEVGQEKTTRGRVFRKASSPAAACSSPADSATGCSWTNHESLVSRRMHRLLRVPPTGSSSRKTSHRAIFSWPTPSAGANPALRAWRASSRRSRSGLL